MHNEALDQLAVAIARRVRDARKATGLRQDELALAAGVSTRAVHAIERGKPTARLDTVMALLNVLGLTLEVHPRPRLARRAAARPDVE